MRESVMIARVLLSALLVLLVPARRCAAVPGEGRTFFVSPTGSDRSPGTLALPFRTLQKARDAVRAIRKRPEGTREPVTIFLRGGTFTLRDPLLLDERDGGTAISPVLYCAYEKEHPLLSGGLRLKGWQAFQSQGKTLWRLVLPRDLRGEVHQLWVNGERRPRARFPDHGYLQVLGIIPTLADSTWMDGQTQFRYDSKELPIWHHLSGGEVVVMNRWVESRLPLVRQDTSAGLLVTARRSVFRLEVGDPFYIENLREALDMPGEWSLDDSSGVLTYYPMPGERPLNVEAFVPRLTQILLLRGSPDSGKYVEHLTFRGLTFAHTEWYFPPGYRSDFRHSDIGGFPQAAQGVPAAIECEGTRHCLFDRCTMTHLGTYALALGKGCRGNSISGCHLSDLGAGGIKIGETVLRDAPCWRTGENRIANCEMAWGGRLFQSAVGIWIGQSEGNWILHNHIHDFFYSGISIGWTWGYGPARAGRNLVELNHIDHIGALSDGDGPLLSDMGGIYTLGTQRGTIIRQNIFHDIAARVYGGWGIYLDEGSSYIVAERNLVYRTTHGGFHQHYGKNNILRNNIFAFGRDHQLMRTRAESHTSYAFEKNIVLWRRGTLFGGNVLGGDAVYDRNVYWALDGASLRFDTLSWSSWQAMGRDVHSIVADPLFVNAGGDDFRLRAESPAFPLGFQVIETERVLDERPVPEVQKPSPPLVHRLLYNNDGSNIPMSVDTLTPELAYRRIDPFAGTGVTTFLHNPNPGQNMGYPSRIAPMYHWDTTRDALSGWPLQGRRMSDNFARLVGEGIDPVEMVLDRARLRGMEAFLTFRMNELHDVDKPGSPLLGPFWKAHPEYRVGGYAGWGKEALNYAIPEVREYYFSLLAEVVRRYDLDGLELDFMRFPYYFPFSPDSMSGYGRIMTAFVRRVRLMIDSVGSARGTHILLAARVPTSLSACAYVGLDPVLWCREGLIDFLTVAPFLSTEVDIPLEEFKRECGRVPVYAGMEYTIGDRMMTREEMRASASLFYASGADGISLFNYFVRWDVGLAPDLEVLTDLVSADSLVGKDKLYTLAESRYPIPGVSLPGQVPLFLETGGEKGVRLKIHEPKRPSAAVLRIECRAGIAPADLRVMLNGTLLAEGAHPSSALVFPQRVPYALPPKGNILEFSVDPGALQGVNTLLLQAAVKCTVQWISLGLRH
jgi:hypothetical protein